MEDITAKSPSELLAVLRGIDISVPLRTHGRTKEHCERWSMCRLLSTLAERNLVSYPLHLHHRDKPDFMLRIAGETIGIEVTEAIPQDYAAASAMNERQGSQGVIDMSLFRWGAEPKTARELREIISQKELTGDGWEGDTPEGEWAEAMHDILNVKHTKLLASDFERLKSNWLLIYDNLPLPNPDNKLSLKILARRLGPYWAMPSRFDSIFIESGDDILLVEPAGTSIRRINNLWKAS